MEIVEKIKKAVVDGNLDETVDLLISYGEEKKIESYIVSNIVGEYNRIKESYLSGTLTSEQYSVNVNKINKRVLELIDHEKRKFGISKKKIYFFGLTFVAVISSLIYVFVFNRKIADPLAKEKIIIYNEIRETVTDLSSFEKRSDNYNNSKLKLDKILNGNISILDDSLMHELLVEYYYDLEQYERRSEMKKSYIQGRSNAISDTIMARILTLK